MFNKYLLVAIGVLFSGCVLFYHLWDNTKMELNAVREQKITLEQELKRRNENEKNLSKRISELTKLHQLHSEYFDTPLPSQLSEQLRKSCKACK